MLALILQNNSHVRSRGKAIKLWCDGMIQERSTLMIVTQMKIRNQGRARKAKKDDVAREDKVEEIIQKLKMQ